MPESFSSKRRSFPKTEAEFIAYCKSRTVVTDKGCWEWQGSTENFRNIKPGQRGYSMTSFRSKRVRLHRWSLAHKLGRPIAPKMQAGHSCDNPPCWNPDHLYETTNQQNHIDGGKRGRMNGQSKTHCKHGHEFTPENTYWSRRYTVNGVVGMIRNCRECSRIKCRQYWKDGRALQRQRVYRAKKKLQEARNEAL
jgi:hypothetical protein